VEPVQFKVKLVWVMVLEANPVGTVGGVVSGAAVVVTPRAVLGAEVLGTASFAVTV
jgi:hypothetical protein